MITMRDAHRRGRNRIALACVAIPLALAAAAPPSHAQSGDTAVALSLFDQGKQLVRDGKYAEACPKLRASYEMVPKLGTLLNLADCLEKNGQTASAWARFTEAQSTAERAGEGDRADFAKQHATALEPKLSRLTVTAPASVSGLQVKRDGEVVQGAVLGVPMPVDPGKHTIEATAPGKTAWSTTLEIPGDGANQILAIPPLQDAPVAAAPPTLAAAGATTVGAPSPAAPAESGGSSQKVWGFAVGGVGAVGVVASLVLGAMAESAYGQSNQAGGCAKDVCPQSALDQRQSAYGLATAATYLAIGGGVLVAGGVVLLVTAPSSKEGSRSGLWIRPGPGGATLGGAW